MGCTDAGGFEYCDGLSSEQFGCGGIASIEDVGYALYGIAGVVSVVVTRTGV